MTKVPEAGTPSGPLHAVFRSIRSSATPRRCRDRRQLAKEVTMPWTRLVLSFQSLQIGEIVEQAGQDTRL